MGNAYQQYLKSRPSASKESVKRAKAYKDMKIGTHPVLKSEITEIDDHKTDILEQLRSFKPKSTIFEIGNTSKNKDKMDVMNEKRKKHCGVIEQNTLKIEQNNANLLEVSEAKENIPNSETNKVTEEEISETFDTIVKESKNRKEKRSKLKERQKQKVKPSKDESNYIPYQPADHHSESGYSMKTGFSAQAHGAVLDFTGDDEVDMRKKKAATVWDKKVKKYVRVQDDKKRIKTESGVYISATYKTNRYNKWKERCKLTQMEERDNDVNGDDDDDDHGARGKKRPNPQLPANHPAMKKAEMAVRIGRKNKNEIKRPEQILKKRVEDERRAARKAKGGGKKKRR